MDLSYGYHARGSDYVSRIWNLCVYSIFIKYSLCMIPLTFTVTFMLY